MLSFSLYERYGNQMKFAKYVADNRLNVNVAHRLKR